MADLAKADSPERSCSGEIVGLGQKESSFDRARDSHSTRHDCVGHYRAAGVNILLFLGPQIRRYPLSGDSSVDLFVRDCLRQSGAYFCHLHSQRPPIRA